MMSDSAASLPEILVQHAAGVTRVTLNRPARRNALTREMLGQLRDLLRSLDSSTRLLVLQANGTTFCAGMDLQEMQQTAERPDAADVWQHDAQLYREVLESLVWLPCPTACVVTGGVWAGGVGLVLACDLILGTSAASFALPEPRRGITAAVVCPLLMHKVGWSAANWLLLTTDVVDAETATRIGLIHKLVPSETLPAQTDTLIRLVLEGAPGALRSTKEQLRTLTAETLRHAWDAAQQLSGAARGTPEAREGLQAFLERRPPAWAPADPQGAP